MPVADATVIVAVSGGADSVSLLLALCELKRRKKHDLRLVAAHFNHKLRGADSDADAEFVRGLTVKHDIEFATAKAGKAIGDGNLEQSARDARYFFLTKTAEQLGAFAVLTGHTVNDQAETFLLNLLRGSGPKGLCGMRPVRSFEFRVPGSESRSSNSEPETRNSEPSPQLVRPLLTWAKRIDTEGYCRDSGVDYRYDTMNEDTAFKRVRIRRILLPLLEDFNPKIIETLANTASLMQQLPETKTTVEPRTELNVREIQNLTQPELYEQIRCWLSFHRGSTRRLALKHTQAIERLILSTKSGRMVEIPGGRVVKSGGRIVYEEKA